MRTQVCLPLRLALISNITMLYLLSHESAKVHIITRQWLHQVSHSRGHLPVSHTRQGLQAVYPT